MTSEPHQPIADAHHAAAAATTTTEALHLEALPGPVTAPAA